MINMEEEIEIQDITEVQQIDSRREMAEALDNQIKEQTNNLDIISQQLDYISSTVDNITPDVDLTEVTDKIDELDTNIITTQNQDILETLNNQQIQINSIEEKLNTILEKITEGNNNA